MIDLATVFYTLGIIFFVVCFILLIGVVGITYTMYSKATKFREQIPMKVLSFFRENNASQLKALGVALVGFVLAFLRGRVQKKQSL